MKPEVLWWPFARQPVNDVISALRRESHVESPRGAWESSAVGSGDSINYLRRVGTRAGEGEQQKRQRETERERRNNLLRCRFPVGSQPMTLLIPWQKKG